MSVAWFGEIKRGPSVHFPTKGASDGPPRAYPRTRPPGRGAHHPVLRSRRRLHPPQSQRVALRIPQAAFGLRDPHTRPLPAVARDRVRTRFLARGRSLFLSPLSGNGG